MKENTVRCCADRVFRGDTKEVVRECCEHRPQGWLGNI